MSVKSINRPNEIRNYTIPCVGNDESTELVECREFA